MKPATMRRVRQLHLYLGLFFAPMLLLFAISGALQVYRINEPKGYGGPPPAWMEWIASIHKNQAPPREKAAKPEQPKPSAAAVLGAAPDRPKAASSGALKLFAVLLALALAVSTLLGIAIALNARATRRIGIAMLVAGTILPIVLLKL